MLPAESADEQSGGGLQFNGVLGNETQLEVRDFPLERDIGHTVEQAAVLAVGRPRPQQRGEPVDLIAVVFGQARVGEQLDQGTVCGKFLRGVERARRLRDQPLGRGVLGEARDRLFRQSSDKGERLDFAALPTVAQVHERLQRRDSAELDAPAVDGAREPAHVLRLGRVTPRPIGKRVPVELVQVLRELRLPQREFLRVVGLTHHPREERHGGGEVQLGERQALGVEVVEGERRVRVDHNGRFAHRFGEALVGKTLLDQQRVAEMICRLKQQILDEGGLAGSGHADQHRVLRRPAYSRAHADQVAVAPVVESLGVIQSADERRGKGQQVGEISVLGIQLAVVVGRMRPAGPGGEEEFLGRRRQRALEGLRTVHRVDGRLHGRDFLAQRLWRRRPHAQQIGHVEGPGESTCKGFDLTFLFAQRDEQRRAGLFGVFTTQALGNFFLPVNLLSARDRGHVHRDRIV